MLFVLLGHYLVWVGYARGWKFIDFFLVLGSTGLEFFFLMSGFLVGGIFLRQCDKKLDAKALGVFIVRRMLRIVPPYIVWLLLLWVFFPPENADLSVLFSFLTFSQNLAWPLIAGTWFDVSWSLAVEFWFYLLFACLGFAGFKLFGNRGILYVMALMFIVPLCARLVFAEVPNWDLDMRKVVVFRLDSIIWGVMLAYGYKHGHWPEKHTGVYALLGGLLLILIIGYWWYHEGVFRVTTYSMQVFVLPVMSFALCLVFPYMLRLQCRASWFRETTEYLSDTSYSVYLVHLTVAGWCVSILIAGHPVLFMLVACSVSFLLGWCSLKFIERPILARRPGS